MMEFHDDAFWEWTMTLRIVQLGSDRSPGEGLRIGTVRRPPRGVKKSEYASKNFYDVWLPTLAPSAALVKLAQGARSGREWDRFMKKYRAEMTTAENRATLDLLAAALGISAGSVVHTLAAALGLSAVLATSASAFLVLKVAGAVYLVYLGVRMLITRTAAFGATDIADSVDTWTAFRQGMLTNVL